MNADDLATLIKEQFGMKSFPTVEEVALYVGHKFLHATGRDPLDPDVFYNVKDYRRAVAYLRIVGLTGFGTGKVAAKLSDRVREMAAWHATGSIVVTKLDNEPGWYIDWIEIGTQAVVDGVSVLLVPCHVDGIGSAV